MPRDPAQPKAVGEYTHPKSFESVEGTSKPAEGSGGLAERKAELAERKSGAAEGKSGAAEGSAELAEGKSGAAERTSDSAERTSDVAEGKLGAAEGSWDSAEGKSGLGEGKSALQWCVSSLIAAIAAQKSDFFSHELKPRRQWPISCLCLDRVSADGIVRGDCGENFSRPVERSGATGETMARSFLPNSDAALLAWGQNFSTLITAAPITYGLTAGQASAFATLLTSYSTALAACDPGVRNKAAVLSKNTARANLKTSARLLAKIIEGQATVTNAQKATLGLNVRATPTPIPPPALAPQVDIVSVVARTVKIRLHNAETSPKRGKPAGVKGAAVFSYVGATPPEELSAWKFEGNTTVTVVDIVFPDSVAAGATVWFIAMWFNERTQNGPAAAPVNAVIQYGLSMAG